MKVVDLSPLNVKAQQGKSSPAWLVHLQAILKYGWGWYQSYQAEERMIRMMRGVLSNHFVLFRGLRLAENTPPLPPILVGPSGVYLFYVWPKPGSYRIRETQWEIMQGKPRRYRPGKPNVVKEVIRLASRASVFFSRVLGKEIKVVPVMVFMDSGADVGSVRPKVRPVLADGLKRYVAQLAKGETVLSPTDLVNITGTVRRLLAGEEAKGRKKAVRRRRRKAAQPPKAVRQVERYFNFTTTQWLILGGIALFVLFMLMGAILYVAMTTY